MKFLPANAACFPFLLLAALLLPACEGTTSTSTGGRAYCNGQLDVREDEIDDQFDVDGDGYFDAANPSCQETYGPELLDCNDSNPEIHPGMTETTCNGVDDDCDAETLDAVDEDEDGYSLCDEDCDDSDPEISPGLAEVVCDDIDNDCDEETLDADDLDGDGWTECDDCVETNADIHPGMEELACDGVDNDCNEATVDGNDGDGDGSSDCFDCDDADPTVYPGSPEVCDDGIDQDCNGIDAECEEETWNGAWSTNAVNYTCGGGNVLIDFQTIAVQDATPSIAFVFVGGLHPGTTNGSIDAADQFNTSASYPGFCSKTFNFNGSFLGANSFSAILTATFTDCSGCTNQSWTVTGTR